MPRRSGSLADVVVLVERRHQLVDHHAGVLVVERVVFGRAVGGPVAPLLRRRFGLIRPAAGVDEHREHHRNLAPLDQVVEHVGRPDVPLHVHERLAVVEDHQAGGDGPVILRRDVDPVGVLRARIRLALDDERAAHLAFRHVRPRQRVWTRAGSGYPGSAPAAACDVAGAAEVRNRSSRYERPDRRERVRAVAGGLVAERQHHRASPGHADDFLLEDLQLRRIDEIVGGVHRQERSLDLLEIRPRIVVAGRLQRVEDVVGVAGLDVGVDVGVDLLVRRRPAWATPSAAGPGCCPPATAAAPRCGARGAGRCSCRSSTRDRCGSRRLRLAATRGCARRSASAGWPAASAHPSCPDSAHPRARCACRPSTCPSPAADD